MPFQLKWTSLGVRSNPAVLFLHGFLGSGLDWMEIAKPLSKKYYCVLIDLPGHGKSVPLSSKTALSLKTVCESLNLLLKKNRFNSPCMVGYSLGGRIALYYAIFYPGTLSGLVIESASAGIKKATQRKDRARLDRSRAKKIIKIGINNFVYNWYQSPFFLSMRNTPIRTNKLIKIRVKNNPYWMAKVISELSPGLQPSVWNKLQKINTLVLLINGKKDKKYSKVIKDMANYIPFSKLHSVKAVGHNVNFETPRYFYKILNRFCFSLHAG